LHLQCAHARAFQLLLACGRQSAARAHAPPARSTTTGSAPHAHMDRREGAPPARAQSASAGVLARRQGRAETTVVSFSVAVPKKRLAKPRIIKMTHCTMDTIRPAPRAAGISPRLPPGGKGWGKDWRGTQFALTPKNVQCAQALTPTNSARSSAARACPGSMPRSHAPTICCPVAIALRRPGGWPCERQSAVVLLQN